MSLRSVVVVGAGIAGSTVAYLLARSGVSVTVVERAAGLRSSGSPVDVRGSALDVMEQMGLLAPLRAAATQVTRLAAVDGRGRVIGWIPTQREGGLEVPRDDLATLLSSTAREHADLRYDDTVTALVQGDDGVEVTFERGAPQRFDLVVGADGLHSTVRRLAFGAEARFSTHLGLYIATVGLERPAADLRTVLVHNEPGRAIVIHPTTGHEGGAFIFRHDLLDAGARSDLRRQKELLTRTYARTGWRAAELLDRVAEVDELYFDSVSRVRLPGWSQGRTVLIGDAASCVSLLGEGSSMAVVGAATLALSLIEEPADLGAALRRYERIHRRRLAPHHRGAAATGHFLVPATRAGLAARNRVLQAYAAAAQRR